MMLNSPTWILPERSGSSLIAKIARFARGSSPKCIVSSSDNRCPPRAALMGSTSPMMSAMVTSGVASFSMNRSSRDSQAIGVFSPRSAISSRPYLEFGRELIAERSEEHTNELQLRRDLVLYDVLEKIKLFKNHHYQLLVY